MNDCYTRSLMNPKTLHVEPLQTRKCLVCERVCMPILVQTTSRTHVTCPVKHAAIQRHEHSQMEVDISTTLKFTIFPLPLASASKRVLPACMNIKFSV